MSGLGTIAMIAAPFERAEYLDLHGEQVYCLRFGDGKPRLKVLLCGGFPSDRMYSLAAWVKWARFLASNGILAVRFDYRGTGESTGEFTRMTLEDWFEDVMQMSRWTASLPGICPLLLHGQGLGGLLAQKAFCAGQGDALLMWSPPQKAADLLQQGLMLRLSMDMMMLQRGQRKSAQGYLDDLAAGRPVEVDGYLWSTGLWQSTVKLSLDSRFAQPRPGIDNASGRPWNHVPLGPELAPLAKSLKLLRVLNPRSAIVPASPLDQDFSAFFQANLRWMLRAIQRGVESVDACVRP